MNQNQKASALILTIGFVALVVSLASAFMVNASSKFDESVSVKLANLAEQAAQSGFIHARKVIIEDYANDNYTSIQSRYRMEFNPLDTAGNPMDSMSLHRPPKNRADTSPRINVSSNDSVTWHAIETYQGDWEHMGNWDMAYGWARIDGRTSRYHDIMFVDDKGNTVDEVIADYVVRYTMEIADEEGKLSVNPDYPGHPLPIDYSDPDNKDYLAYKSYIHRFAKAMRSMNSAIAEERLPQEVYTDYGGKTFYHLYDQILEGVNASGGGVWSNKQGYNNEVVRYDRLFRGTGTQVFDNGGWHERPGWLALLPGKVFSYNHIRSTYQSEDHIDKLRQRFSPFASGLRDDDWPAGQEGFDSTITNIPNPNCPWVVNVPTMTTYAQQSVIFGLSSQLRAGGYGPNWDKGGSGTTLDLFGKNYPEAFPLSLDSGRYVPLIGGDLAGSKVINGTNRLPGVPFTCGKKVEYPVPDMYANSYWWDVAAALWKATSVGKSIWSFKGDIHKNGADKEVFVYDPNCRITTAPGDLSENPGLMLAQLESEFLRILGERVDISVGGGPSLTYGLNQGLLATPITNTTVTVGYGPQPETKGLWDRVERDGNVALGINDIELELTTDTNAYDQKIGYRYTVGARLAERKAQLQMGENTRSMEYLLNDVRMSIFGTPALNFNYDDASGNNSVDTSADGEDAESTVNGWWGYDDLGNRTRYWSWWFEGVDITYVASNNWLQMPGWFRFYRRGGSPFVARYNGTEWQELNNTERDLFFDINKHFLEDDFLSDPAAKPIKPFSATGRFQVKRSRIFNIVCRGEVYDINVNSRISQFRAEQILHVDPNKDEDLSDTVVLYQRSIGRNKSGSAVAE